MMNFSRIGHAGQRPRGELEVTLTTHTIADSGNAFLPSTNKAVELFQDHHRHIRKQAFVFPFLFRGEGSVL